LSRAVARAVFIGRLAGGRDFNRHILWSFYFSTDQTGARKPEAASNKTSVRMAHAETYCGRRASCKAKNAYGETKTCWPGHLRPFFKPKVVRVHALINHSNQRFSSSGMSKSIDRSSSTPKQSGCFVAGRVTHLDGSSGIKF
jgi:hypothetical protein